MDRSPSRFTRKLIYAARALGVLAVVGGVSLFGLFAFDLMGAPQAARWMAGLAGGKMLHDALIGLRRYIDKTALSTVGPFEVSLSFTAAALLVGSVALQISG